MATEKSKLLARTEIKPKKGENFLKKPWQNVALRGPEDHFRRYLAETLGVLVRRVYEADWTTAGMFPRVAAW